MNTHKLSSVRIAALALLVAASACSKSTTAKTPTPSNAAAALSPVATTPNPWLVETCGNGIDDDSDGSVDEGCAPAPTPTPTPTVSGEICGDFIDNDLDGWFDEGCYDDDAAGDDEDDDDGTVVVVVRPAPTPTPTPTPSSSAVSAPAATTFTDTLSSTSDRIVTRDYGSMSSRGKWHEMVESGSYFVWAQRSFNNAVYLNVVNKSTGRLVNRTKVITEGTVDSVEAKEIRLVPRSGGVALVSLAHMADGRESLWFIDFSLSSFTVVQRKLIASKVNYAGTGFFDVRAAVYGGKAIVAYLDAPYYNASRSAVDVPSNKLTIHSVNLSTYAVSTAYTGGASVKRLIDMKVQSDGLQLLHIYPTTTGSGSSLRWTRSELVVRFHNLTAFAPVTSDAKARVFLLERSGLNANSYQAVLTSQGVLVLSPPETNELVFFRGTRTTAGIYSYSRRHVTSMGLGTGTVRAGQSFDLNRDGNGRITVRVGSSSLAAMSRIGDDGYIDETLRLAITCPSPATGIPAMAVSGLWSFGGIYNGSHWYYGFICRSESPGYNDLYYLAH